MGQLLQSQGYELDIRCPALGESLPESLDQHEATVIFGGPMSANDDQTLPFIRTELDWIPVVLDAGKPLLGICLGAQLLARVLGAIVAPHPQDLREIGYFPIHPTLSGQGPLGQPMQVYHWHREGFELPDGAVLLAGGDTFRHQAFRYGETAYGLQFHPEITQDLIRLWTSKAADQLSLAGAQSREEQMQKHQLHGPTVQVWLAQFLKQWLASPLRSWPESAVPMNCRTST